ncbi:MAG: hypothetical protein KDC54_25070, partial [Lewinella sp.]|nr:hypothetical protein [Lewinella sp.]
MKPGLQKILTHLIAVVVFLVIAAAYFYPQFQGKKIQQGDIVQYQGMSQEVRQYQAETGEYSLWTNAMFGGMPAYQIRTVSAGNQLSWTEQVLRLGIPRPAGQFFAAMLCFYILLVVIGVNPWLSILGAFAFGFTTNNLILYEAGHETKLRAISYLPLIAAGMILAYRQRSYLWGGILFALGLGLDLTANHVQMTYYLAMTAVIYGIAQLIHDARAGKLAEFAKGSGALVIGAALAVGAVSSNLWVTYEYSKDTMRGEPILESAAGETDENNSSQTDGLAWNYAMNWSNGTVDLFSVFIPGVAGGGSQEPTTRSSAYGQAMTQLGARLPQKFDAPLYWGALPFTS